MEMVNKKINIILLMMFCFIGLVSAGVEYTPTTKTICDNGVCTKTLYSGIQNVYEDGVWKDIKEARSLKGKGFDVSYIENDSNFTVEVLDFNYTSIKVNLKVKDKAVKDNKVPLRLWKQNETKAADYEKAKKNEEKKSSKDALKEYKEKMTKIKDNDISFFSAEDEYVGVYDFGFGDVLEFGYNSTTVTLQDADTEVLEDANIWDNGPDFSKGDGKGFFMFNISSIPSDINITNASFNFYVTNRFSNWDNDLNFYRISEQNWSEDDDYSVLKSLTKTNMLSFSSVATSTGWAEVSDISSAVNVDYGSNDYFSLLVEDPDDNGTAQSKDYGTSVFITIGDDQYNGNSGIIIASKEYSNSSLRPYLNITYSEDSSCNNSIVNSTWSSWSDIETCQPNSYLTQNRSLVQYDENACGDTANITYYESQEVNCDYNIGLLCQYNFNENTGTTAHDLIGNCEDETITGATWDNDGVLNSLIGAAEDYQQVITTITDGGSEDLVSIKSSSSGAISGFFTNITIWFSLMGVIFILSIIIIVVVVVNKIDGSIV